MDGLILVRKPVPATSHDVVAALRKILNQKRIGHFGTLDPLASGLLLAAVGKATRLFPFYSKMDKIYEGRIRLGFSTDTFDTAGLPTSTACEIFPDRPAVEDALRDFGGEITQIPPPYSAKKVGGTPLYVYARRKTPVDGRPFQVRVHSFELLEYVAPHIDFAVKCGSGTYIRTLAHDLGQRLGCGAHLAGLVRTGIGEFSLKDGLTLEEIRGFQEMGATGRFLLPMESLLPSLAMIKVSEEGVQWIRNGRPVSAEQIADAEGNGSPVLRDDPTIIVRVFSPDGRLIALARPAARPGHFAPFLVLY
jgi:tRNA pseudouridine55 synthase